MTSAQLTLLTAAPADAATTVVTYNYTGAAQSFTVPTGVTTILVDARGAQGGAGNAGAIPGRGATVQSRISVTPGQTLSIRVGGQGGNAPGSGGGFNGGATGGSSAGGGGGASDVRLGTTRLVVAAGGGGSGGNDGPSASSGGSGGAPNGGAGAAGTGGNGGQGGGGGTTTAGGAGGSGPVGNGSAGTSGAGGAGATDGGQGRGGGGGGGGLFGGGGGGAAAIGGGGGGGGGGSSFANGTGTVFTAGTQVGHGRVVLTFSAPQCNDGIDNDSDGHTDYPNDPGCASANDESEGVPCTFVAGLEVCIGLEAGQTIERVTVFLPGLIDGSVHTVVGHVDLYRFVLPGGTTVSLPCVVLGVDGTVLNPCAVAGGTLVERIATLVDDEIEQPFLIPGGPIATIGLCEAELTATVNGIGVNSLAAVTIC